MMILDLVVDEFVNILCDFLDSLDEFGLADVTPFDAFHEHGKIDVICIDH